MPKELVTIPVEAHNALIALAREVSKNYEDAADWKDAKPRLTDLATKALDQLGPTIE